MLTANLTYTRGEQEVAGRDKEPADRIPPLSGFIGIEYVPESAFGFEAWVAMSGAQDRLSNRDIRDNRIDPEGTPGWASIGFRATWRASDAWMWIATFSNVLDADFRVHGSGIDAVGQNLAIEVRRSW